MGASLTLSIPRTEERELSAMSKLSVLLVHQNAGHVVVLERILQEQQAEVLRAGSCQEAARLLASSAPPHLVFTDTLLPDGHCIDILQLAAQAAEPVNVIVAARVADIRLYLEAMENGAYDFITPSFSGVDLSHVLRVAAEHVVDRRESRRRLSVETGLRKIYSSPT